MTAIKMLAVAGLLAAAPATAMAHDHDHHRSWSHGRAPVVVRVAPRPTWVPGYWSHRGPHRVFVQGAWATPPQAGWTWVAPQQVWDPYHRTWVWREGYWAPSPALYGQVSYR
jgi:hypothetical protein